MSASSLDDKELLNSFFTREQSIQSFLYSYDTYAFVDDSNQAYPAARPSPEHSLTALAQLGILKLRAQRGLICLFDKNYCYTIAESSSASKLIAPNAVDNDLLLCGSAVRRSFSLPNLILKEALHSIYDDSNSTKIPFFTVPDLLNHDTFRTHPFILAHSHQLRFCIAAPIRKKSGAFIGVYCVFDHEPRQEIDTDDAAYLTDLSQLILDHLESMGSRTEFNRTRRMVRGMGSFVENKSTVSGLSKSVQSGNPRDEYSSGDQEGMLNALQQESQRAHIDADSERLFSNLSRDTNANLRDWVDAIGMQPLVDVHESEDASPVTRSRSKSSTLIVTPNASQLSNDPATTLSQLFSRASNIIREAIEVEGVLFFDASVRSWGGLVRSDHKDNSTTTGSSTVSTSSSNEDDQKHKYSKTGMNAEERFCDVFGFSTTNSSSVDDKRPSPSHSTVPEKFLRILLRRYPKGKIFNFSEDGNLVSTSDSDWYRKSTTNSGDESKASKRRKKPRSYSRANESVLINQIFPGARSILAFPIWDSHRERWFAGGVVWTKTPTRTFSYTGEMTYLHAFGIVIMAEVARLDAEMAKNSKNTLLSSISHELRSPLHGILGCVEILQNTEIDTFQTNVLHSIDACSVMLLDTIDHLLTQSEINQAVMKFKSRRRAQRDSNSRNPETSKVEANHSTTTNSLELDEIIEQVVESMVAGYEYTHSRHKFFTNKAGKNEPTESLPTGSASDNKTTELKHRDKVRIIIDIESSANWQFDAEAGAIRRIVMNIFGNSLKYTDAGHIKVRATQSDLSENSKNSTSEVKIVFEDTGKGISPEYVSNHLFKPFSQEDRLSQGTGLGLSITHDIVAGLNGKIAVESKVGQGTTLTVSMKLKHTDKGDRERIVGSFQKEITPLKGLRLALYGFEDKLNSSSGNFTRTQTDWQLPRSNIASICKDWMKMDVLSTSEDKIQPDIYVSTESGAQELIRLNRSGTVIQPVVVICSTIAMAQKFTQTSKTMDKFGVFEYISQPCGPRKLVKTLTLCLRRWSDIHIEQALLIPPSPVNKRPDSITRTSSVISSSNSIMTPSFINKISGQGTELETEYITTRQSLKQAIQPNPVEPPKDNSQVAPFLVVDDNQINLKILVALLSRKSIPFTTAVDGKLAVDAYKASHGHFTCIFMDIQMPNMDGLTATQLIRDYEKTEKLEPVMVVALTGLVTEEKQKQAKACGVDQFYAKPVRLKTLNEVVNMALAGKRNSDAV